MLGKIFKKIAILVICICVVYMCALTSWMFNQKVYSAISEPDANGIVWWYSLSGGKATNVTAYEGTITGDTLYIPSKIDGYNVVSLGSYVESRLTGAENIKCVSVPSTVTSINQKAFVRLANLETIDIDAGNTSYKSIDGVLYSYDGKTLVSYPNGKSEIVFSNTVEKIGGYAFCGDYATPKYSGTLVLPSTLKEIGESAFYFNKAITAIDFSNCTNLNIIGSQAFGSCSNLSGDLSIPNSVTELGYNAFGYTNIGGTVSTGNGITEFSGSMISNCQNVNKLIIGSNVDSISYLYYVSGLETIEVDPGNTSYKSIDGVLYSYDEKTLVDYPIAKEFTGIMEFSDTLEKIEEYAFYRKSNIDCVIKFPSSLKEIGYRAFAENEGIKAIDFSDCTSLEKIGNSAFYKCTSLMGDVRIPDSVTEIGSSAFSNCTSINGAISTGNGVSTINDCAFEDCTNARKISVGNSVTDIKYKAFNNITELWIDNLPENVTIASNFAGDTSETCRIHYRGCTHKLTVSSVPEIKIINADTGEELTTGDYECDCKINFKLQMNGQNNYENIKLYVLQENDYNNVKIYNISTANTYSIERLNKDSEIFVQNISKEVDLSLRTFITKINVDYVTNSREPIVMHDAGDFAYAHTKFPINVQPGDVITQTIRVYNEGESTGIATKISMYIPDGMELQENSNLNDIYGWKNDGDNKISTTYLSGKEIKGYNGTSVVKYEDLMVALKVKSDIEVKDTDIRLVPIAQIEEMDGTDSDSHLGSITACVAADYKKDESLNSTNASYIKGTEDDDDFENIVIPGRPKCDYTIKIDKIDEDTNELLAGGKFNLMDENGTVLKTAETGVDGSLDFGVMSTYGEGEDIYYIEEKSAPAGYTTKEKILLKLTIKKVLEDASLGKYTTTVICELADYTLDLTRFEYAPINTVDELKNITTNGKYKLMKDLDLQGIDWEPLPQFEGILDGNGHKISNLTIVKDTTDLGEIGLFRVFAGTVSNLELENVNIQIGATGDDKLTEFSGVGGFAGVMIHGAIRDCKVSGNITASAHNVGGFVGQTGKDNIVRVSNCINKANVAQKGEFSNVGGIIGTTLGAISVKESSNEGEISTEYNNAGGIVGCVIPSDYIEKEIRADYDDENKVISIAINNVRTSGKYDLKLEILDSNTLGLVEGGIYSVFDNKKKVIPGCNKVTLENGKLDVATVEIENLGVDTYYIREWSTIANYNKVPGLIKVEVRRYWDEETGEFKVSTTAELITEEEFENGEVEEIPDTLPSQTGKIYAKTNFENVSYNGNKAEFVNNTNSGKVKNISDYYYHYNAGGIVGKSEGYIIIDGCENSGEISSTSTAAGIIADLYDKTSGKENIVNNCKNTGRITAENFGTAGIVGTVVGNINVSNCLNEGTIDGKQCAASGGIIAEATGTINIDSCVNKGEVKIEKQTSMGYPAGGIIANQTPKVDDAHDRFNESSNDNLNVTNCTNEGNVQAPHHLGGIAGCIVAKQIYIDNCKCLNCEIKDVNSADKAGIIGNARANNILISNSQVDNVKAIKDEDSERRSSYGKTGGIIGMYEVPQGSGSMDTIKIDNCKVSNSTIETYENNVGGIIGGNCMDSLNKLMIVNCAVEKCDINNIVSSSTTYSSAGGLISTIFNCNEIIIEDNIVKESNVGVLDQADFDTNVGGMIGLIQGCATVRLSNNNCIDSTITSEEAIESSPAGAGGIIGECDDGYTDLEMKKCNVINTTITGKGCSLGGLIAQGYGSINFKIYDCLVKDCSLLNNISSEDLRYHGYYSNMGGCIGHILINDIIISGCEVNNTKINAIGAYCSQGMGGIIGDARCSTPDIENCKVINNCKIECTAGEINGNRTQIGGIIGSTEYSGANISSCIVDHISMSANTGETVAGIMGHSQGDTNIKDCSVTNAELTNSTIVPETGSTIWWGPCAAGIIGTNTGTNQINNCKVENVELNGKDQLGGISGYQVAAVINNCNVKEITINDLSKDDVAKTYSQAIGGLVACCSNSLESTYNTVKDITINSIANSTGGLVGYAKEIAKLELCSVENATITAETHTHGQPYNATVAGIIGDVGSVTDTIKSITARDITITTKSDNMAGLFGTITGDASLENCGAYNVKLTNTNNGTLEAGNIGGVASYVSGKLNLKDIYVEDSEFKVTGTARETLYVGGLVGFSNDVITNNVYVKNSTLENATNGSVGGLVGMTNKEDGVVTELTITSTQVTGTDEKAMEISGAGNVGGMLGLGKLNSIDNAVKNKVEKLIIKGKSTTSILGKIVGNMLDGSNITNVTETDVQLDTAE